MTNMAIVTNWGIMYGRLPEQERKKYIALEDPAKGGVGDGILFKNEVRSQNQDKSFAIMANEAFIDMRRYNIDVNYTFDNPGSPIECVDRGAIHNRVYQFTVNSDGHLVIGIDVTLLEDENEEGASHSRIIVDGKAKEVFTVDDGGIKKPLTGLDRASLDVWISQCTTLPATCLAEDEDLQAWMRVTASGVKQILFEMDCNRPFSQVRQSPAR